MRAALAALIAFVCAGPAAWAQDTQRPEPAPPGPIRVFLDCDGCFADFLRSQLEFVDHVRDRTEADVHVLVTSTQTGSGGREYTVAFIGVRIRDQLSLPRRDATPEEILLRLRQLQSGYEYRLSVGMTYTFGSIFSSIVNPRFGQ